MNTDEELWNKIKKGDERAFSSLFYRYSGKMYRNAYFFLKDTTTSEQVVHDVFMGIWNGRLNLEIHCFKAYLTSATRYQVYKHIKERKATRIDFIDNIEDLNFLSQAVYNDGLSNMGLTEIELDIKSSLDSLPKRCREIFLMSRWQSLSNQEIATQFGISKRTVENQITNALKHLRSSIKDIGVILIILGLFLD